MRFRAQLLADEHWTKFARQILRIAQFTFVTLLVPQQALTDPVSDLLFILKRELRERLDMRNLMVLCALLLFSIPAGAQVGNRFDAPIGDSYNFADMKWGIPPDEVRRVLTSQSFKVSVDNDGDFRFEGTLAGVQSVGFAIFVNNSLAKVTVSLLTRERDARTRYTDMKEILSRKYGSPTDDFAFFNRPYYDGDGYEEQAIRLGKGTFACYWMGAKTGRRGNLGLAITERLTIQVSYESPLWKLEFERKKAKGTQVFD